MISGSETISRTGSTSFGKRQQLKGQVLGAHRRIFGIIQSLQYRVFRLCHHPGEGDIAHDGGQNIVEIVGYPARKHAQGFEFFHFEKIQLHSFAFGYIGEHTAGTDEFMIAVEHRGSGYQGPYFPAILAAQPAFVPACLPLGALQHCLCMIRDIV